MGHAFTINFHLISVIFSDLKTTVSCHNNYMEILLNRNSFNVSKYETITLKNSQCAASVNSTHIILGSAPNACGAARRETDTHLRMPLRLGKD